jgi:hypothetical protein
MTTSLLETAQSNLYNHGYLPIPLSSAAARVDQLRAIAASDYSVSHRLREMLLTRIRFDAEISASPQEETSVFEQVLAEGQRVGTLWAMDSPATATALIAATNALSPNGTATQVVDLLLQGLVRTSLPNWELERAAV